MADFLDTLKERYTEATKRWEEAQIKLRDVQAQATEAQQEAAAWRIAIEREEARAKKPNVPTVVRARTTDAMPQQLRNVEVSDAQNKTELIKNVVATSGEKGTTPADVWEAVKALEVSRNYVYSVLYKLKERKVVTERRGRYYLVQQPETGEQPTLLQ